jgi:steroid delta-isomerase-like uncharacterized protein
MATQTAPSNADLVRGAFDALNRRDLAAIRPFWTADTIERFPDRTCRGSDEIAAYFEATFAAIPDWRLDIVALAAQGEHVFVHWHMTGTHAGTLLGIAATGKPIELDGMDHFVIANGKVVSNDVVFDQMAFARQIGLLPPDGTLVDRALKSAFGMKTKLARTFAR